MTAFENAKKFFLACEAPEGWAGCKQYVAKDAPFVAQSEPLVDIDTVEAYCDWMAGFGTIAPGATYDLHTSSYDEESRMEKQLKLFLPSSERTLIDISEALFSVKTNLNFCC